MGKVNQVQKRLTPSRVVFGFEGDATDEQIKNSQRFQKLIYIYIRQQE